eukprot:GGOE01020279.1.p1 GENE.GGOE01020279.1~~GGOE01020279.1.p1  ORF type:complete len:590 (-),score=35.40 GGOE01020279.1:622-2391(-)
MEEERDSHFVLLEDDRNRSAKGPRSNGQKRQPFYATEGMLAASVKSTEGSMVFSSAETKAQLPDVVEKENLPVVDFNQKVQSVTEGCLLEKFKAESGDKGNLPPEPSTPRRGSVTPPQTPPRATRTPQSKPPLPWSPQVVKKSPTPHRGYNVLCTPPKHPRMVHNPYRLPCTPPPCKSPANKRSPMSRASPKPRTPTRTRLALMKQNTPSPGLSSQFSATPQPHLSFTLAGTPSSSATPTRLDSSSPSPMAFEGRQARANLATTTATQFLQFNAVAEHLPPSLAPSAYCYEGSIEAQLQFAGYGPQYASTLEDLLRSSPSAYLSQYTQQGLSSPGVQYAHIQRSVNSPLLSDYGGSTPTMAQYSTGYSPAARFLSPLAPSSPQGSVQGMLMHVPTGRYSGSPTTPQQMVPTMIFALVEFKRGRTVQFQSAFLPKPGDYLVVEGDEGEDMGMVVNAWIAPANSPPVVNNSLNSNKASSGRDVDPMTGEHIYPQVLRHATPKEVHYMHNVQAEAEIKCAEVARHKVYEHHLPMRVIDAEYQFDRKKLTFYYDATERVDFRELLRDLFKLYRARIWMSKIRSHEGYDERRPR